MNRINAKWATAVCLAASTLVPAAAFVMPAAGAAEPGTAASSSASGSAASSASTSAPAMPAHHHRWHHRSVFGRLHNDLKLNANQEALWRKARATMKQGMMKQRDIDKQMRQTLIQKLRDPQVDLKALANQMDQERSQQQQVRDEIRDQWIAFYASLDAGQQGQVRQFMLDRLQRPNHDWRHGKHQEHDHGGRW
jgi:uncharacterized membrane protein